MKTEDIMYIDYRKEENKEIIQKALRKIKAFSKFEEGTEVPLEELEKGVFYLASKYKLEPQWITMGFKACDKNILYSASLKTSDTYKWLGSVYGKCLYELFAKLVIKMYSEIKVNKIEKRNGE